MGLKAQQLFLVSRLFPIRCQSDCLLAGRQPRFKLVQAETRVQEVIACLQTVKLVGAIAIVLFNKIVFDGMPLGRVKYRWSIHITLTNRGEDALIFCIDGEVFEVQ